MNRAMSEPVTVAVLEYELVRIWPRVVSVRRIVIRISVAVLQSPSANRLLLSVTRATICAAMFEKRPSQSLRRTSYNLRSDIFDLI